MIVFAGVNGSGKSTLYRGFNNNDILYLNADEIALTLGDQHDSLVQFKAGKLLIGKLNTVLRDGNSFIIETTLSGTSLFSYIKKAK